jgi:hypothetical protein
MVGPNETVVATGADLAPAHQQRRADRVHQGGPVLAVGDGTRGVQGQGEQAAEPQHPAQAGELGGRVAVQGQEPHSGQQPDDAEVDRGADEPGDPRGDAQVQAQVCHVAEAEREGHQHDRGGDRGDRAAGERLAGLRGAALL